MYLPPASPAWCPKRRRRLEHTRKHCLVLLVAGYKRVMTVGREKREGNPRGMTVMAVFSVFIVRDKNTFKLHYGGNKCRTDAFC